MREVIIDNNGIDPFVDIPGAYEAALAAIDRGDLKIWYVHITLSEAAATRDEGRRTRLLLALTGLGQRVASYGLVFDESRLDQMAFTDDSGDADLEALASGDLNHDQNRRDALVASTAKAHGWAILTNETKRLPNRARAHGVAVLTNDELFAEIRFAPAATDS